MTNVPFDDDYSLIDEEFPLIDDECSLSDDECSLIDSVVGPIGRWADALPCARRRARVSRAG
jgi:hypothetical protein